MKRLGTIGKMCTICILCLIMVFGLTSCAKDEAIKSFNVLASDINQLQNNISKKIVDIKTLLSQTNAKDLADPNLLKQLQSEIDSAKNNSAVVPHVASDTDAIKKQIQDLTKTKNKLQEQSDSLDSAVSAINASKQKLIDQIAAEKAAQDKADEAYNAKIQQYKNSSSYYAKYDIDKDGIPELIVKTGTCEADMTNYVYTYKNGKLIYAGSFSGGHQSSYALSDQNGMLSLMGQMGYEVVNKITLYNDTINVSTIIKKNIGNAGYDEFPNEIKMTSVL